MSLFDVLKIVFSKMRTKIVFHCFQKTKNVWKIFSKIFLEKENVMREKMMREGESD